MNEKKFPTGSLLNMILTFVVFIVTGILIFFNSDYKFYEDLVQTIIEVTFGISAITLIYTSVTFFKEIRDWQYAKSEKI